MSKIQPITAFEIGRKHHRTDLELFQDWALDMRKCLIDGKPAKTRKGNGVNHLWRVEPVAESKLQAVDQKPCVYDASGNMTGDAKRLAQLEAVKAAYASGEYESYEHPFDPNGLTNNPKLARLLADESEGATRRVVAPLDWASETVDSL